MEPLEFSDRLRWVLGEAREEAARLQHEHIGTDHLLLALLRDGDRDDGRPSVAITVVDALGVNRAQLRRVIEETVLRGRGETTPPDQLAYTASAKAVLELALTEARVLKSDAVGTEHLLLGLLREDRSIAAKVLLDHGITADKVRSALVKLS